MKVQLSFIHQNEVDIFYYFWWYYYHQLDVLGRTADSAIYVGRQAGHPAHRLPPRPRRLVVKSLPPADSAAASSSPRSARQFAMSEACELWRAGCLHLPIDWSCEERTSLLCCSATRGGVEGRNGVAAVGQTAVVGKWSSITDRPNGPAPAWPANGTVTASQQEDAGRIPSGLCVPQCLSSSAIDMVFALWTSSIVFQKRTSSIRTVQFSPSRMW